MSNKANFLDQTSSLTSSLTRKAIEERQVQYPIPDPCHFKSLKNTSFPASQLSGKMLNSALSLFYLSPKARMHQLKNITEQVHSELELNELEICIWMDIIEQHIMDECHLSVRLLFLCCALKAKEILTSTLDGWINMLSYREKDIKIIYQCWKGAVYSKNIQRGP